MRRTHRYAGSGECQKIAFNPIGQVVGQINEIESAHLRDGEEDELGGERKSSYAMEYISHSFLTFRTETRL